jgi:uroporphyrinogen III methyltransferase/synthase
MKDPLKDIHIVVTRDQDQSGNLINKLTALGGQVSPFPTIKINPPSDWSSCDFALEHIEAYNWIIFSSVNGVRYFLKRAEKHQIKYFRASIASVGQKTADVLSKYGITANLIPSSFTTSGLLKVFRDIDLTNQQILIPTSNRSRNELATGLRKMGAQVEKVVCYQTGIPDIQESDPRMQSILHKKVDCFTFYSPSAFLSLIDMIGKEQLKRILSDKTAIAAIGPTTARAIQNKGYQVQIQPEKSLDESMVDAIVSYFNKMN